MMKKVFSTDILTVLSVLSTRVLVGTANDSNRKEDLPARCKAICKDFFEHGLDKTFCRPALDLIPRPSIFQSCVMGRVAAFEHICMPTCMGHNITTVTYDSHAVCQVEEKKQNPMAHVSWCRKAYDATIPEITSIIAARSPLPRTATTDTSSTSATVSEKPNNVITNSGKVNNESSQILSSETKAVNEAIKKDEILDNVSDGQSLFDDIKNSGKVKNDIIQEPTNDHLSKTAVTGENYREKEQLAHSSGDQSLIINGNKNSSYIETDSVQESSDGALIQETAKEDEKFPNDIGDQGATYGASQQLQLDSILGQSFNVETLEENFNADDSLNAEIRVQRESPAIQHSLEVETKNDNLGRLFNSEQETPLLQVTNELVEKLEWQNNAASELEATNVFEDAEF